MTTPYTSSNEFRSDTFTTPTPAMLEAMTKATFGDSVYAEDVTTSDFESRIAKLTGKEAAMFAVSGTMTNQLGVRVSLYQPPYSILCDYRAHIYTSEANGLAMLSQAMVYPVKPSNGVYLTLADVKKGVILGDNIHTSPTALIALENTLSGSVMPIEEIKAISQFAKEHGIRMHLDGARLWNASVATSIPLSEYCQYFDTVSLCLSKGIGAPVGSILVGSKKDIEKAIWFKKQTGGGIRQAGVLTAAANVAIDQVWPTMKDTHAKVKEVAAYFKTLGVYPALPVDTSFYVIDCEKSGINVDFIAEEADKHNVLLWGERIVFHHQVSDEAIENLKKTIEAVVQRSRAMKKEDLDIALNESASNNPYVYGHAVEEIE